MCARKYVSCGECAWHRIMLDKPGKACLRSAFRAHIAHEFRRACRPCLLWLGRARIPRIANARRAVKGRRQSDKINYSCVLRRGSATAPCRETLHAPRTPVLIAMTNRRGINAALSLLITYLISIGIFAFPKLRAARASCGSLRPCGRGGCAAPLAALGGRKPRCRKLLYHF